MIFRLSLVLLRLVSRVVPRGQRGDWLQEWESELRARRGRLLSDRHALSRRQEVDMLRRVLGSVHDAAWLRRQFTRDADLVHDLRYGCRLLKRSPAFTLLTVTVLALGIGATTAMFSVVEALLVRQLPYRDPERIVVVFEAPVNNRRVLDAVAPANVIDWQEQARSLDLAAVEPYGFTYTGGSEPQSLPGARVTKGFFEIFGLEPLYGRTFTPDEHTPGRNQVVVLSHGVWARQFGADPGIVGRAIRLNGQPHVVVGVMPAAFAPRLLVTFNERGVWSPKVWSDADRQLRGAHFYNVVAKLKPGTTRQQTQAELEGIAENLAKQYPRTNTGQTVQIISLRDHLAGDLRESIRLLAGAVALLLVIAMANTANLLLARSATRAREIGVRMAIGANWGRLMRQLLAETLLLAALGCLAGLLVAHGSARLIVSFAPADIPGLAMVGVNGRVLLFSSALTCVAALMIGGIPAWRAAAIGASTSLSDSSTGDARVAPRQRGRATFVVAQLALALTLLAGGGLLLRSFSSLLSISPGFMPRGVAALQLFSRGGNRTPAQRAALFHEIVESMRTLPQVREVGAASVVPFLDTSSGTTTSVVIEGRPTPAAGDEPSAFITAATTGYFAAMRIPLMEGRLFTEHDDAERAPVAIVSRTFAEKHWREDSPIAGHIRFRAQGSLLTAEIVGVVGDVRHDGLDRPPNQEVFVPHRQLPVTEMTFVARMAGDPTLALPALKSRVYAVAPNQPVYRTAVLQDLVASSLNDRRFMLTLVLAFAALAVALAAAGVYGVMTLTSTQRTREFGIRLALGARRSEILGMVLREGGAITLIGIGAGLLGTLMISRLLESFLFGIGPYDPWTLAGVCTALAVVAAIACLIPAIRATRVSPVIALRAE
jgi:putative ABC transport system permease protein